MTPVLRFWLSLAALVIAATVGGALWPTVPGLVGVLLALLVLLPLTLVTALDLTRQLRQQPSSASTVAARTALALPLGLLALLSLGLALATVAFMVDRWDTASARQLWGSAIICALFLGFGVKVLKALWSRRRD